jgi:predicted ester cyclase
MENKTKSATHRTSNDPEIQERNKAYMAKIMTCFEEGNNDLLDEYLEENVIEHTPDPMLKGTGREYVKQLFTIYRNAFPDLKITINDLIAEDNKVACYTTFSGTNTGPLMGMQPTNKTMVVDQMDICTFRNGKVSEHWGVADMMSMMNQLGIKQKA